MEGFDWILLAGAATALYMAYQTMREQDRHTQRPRRKIGSSEEPMVHEWYDSLPAAASQGSGDHQSARGANIRPSIPRDHLRDPVEKQSQSPVQGEYMELQLIIDNIQGDNIFNPANLPVTTSGSGEKRDVYQFANKFIYKLGKRAGMGLSIIDIKNVKRVTTEAQTLFRYDVVVQRDTPIPAQEMAILRIEMIMDFSQPSNEKFFDDYMLTKEPTPKLQSVKLVSTVRDYSDPGSEAITQYYAITPEDEEGDFTSEADIQRTLRQVRAKHNDESGQRNALLDEYGQEVFEGWRSGRGGDLDEICSGIGTKSVSRRLRENMCTPNGVSGVEY
jgi:hypothetical protein